MRVLVSDSSILIELSKWSLLEAIFRLPFEFAIPDALYAEELIDLNGVDRKHLLALGLRVASLDGQGMAKAISYQQARTKLTLHDCMAVTLAATHHWTLLTGDRHMRILAEAERIETHGVLWLIDHLHQCASVPTDTLVAALAGMLADPKSHIPPAEMRSRISQLSAP